MNEKPLNQKYESKLLTGSQKFVRLCAFHLFVQRAGATAGRWTESRSAGSGKVSPTPARKELVVTQVVHVKLKASTI